MAAAAKNSLWSSWFLKGAFLNFGIMLIFCFFHPGDLIEQINEENTEHVSLFGEDTYRWVEQTGMEWYVDAIEKTGIRVRVHKELYKMVQKPEWKERVNAVFIMIQQFFIRCGWLLVWLPAAGLITVSSWVDGICQWQGRRWSFAYQSPWEHAWARKLIHVVPVTLLTLMCLPVHLPPETVPAVLLMLAIALNRSAANMSKKI